MGEQAVSDQVLGMVSEKLELDKEEWQAPRFGNRFLLFETAGVALGKPSHEPIQSDPRYRLLGPYHEVSRRGARAPLAPFLE